MTVKEFYDFFEARLPRELAASWDNDGLSCCPDPTREVHRVLVALDLTAAAVERAIAGGFDLILTHHPLIFRGIKALVPEGTVPTKVLRLAMNGIAAMAFHTRLDAAAGGVNDVLAARLGVLEAAPFGVPGEVPCGRIGSLPQPMTARCFAESVKSALGTSGVLLAGDPARVVKRIALLGGEGGDYMSAAAAAGADLYLSGRIGYHRMLDAPEDGLILIEAGHHATERPVLEILATWLREADPTLEIEIMPAPALTLI